MHVEEQWDKKVLKNLSRNSCILIGRLFDTKKSTALIPKIPRRYPEDSSYIINEYLNRFYLFYQNEYGCMSLLKNNHMRSGNKKVTLCNN